MSLYTGSIKGLSRAPYRDQVIMLLIKRGADERLSENEETKIARVSRFLPAADCAAEIDQKRNA